MENKIKTECGTFHFCLNCPPPQNCCTGKYIDMPVLTPEDINIISKKKGLLKSNFSIPTTGKLAQMKKKDGSCYFYKNNNCTIYSNRPIDCRLFPFDIRKNLQNEFFLIYYTNACPKSFYITKYINKIKNLIESIYPYKDEYVCRRWSLLLDNYEYKIFEKLSPKSFSLTCFNSG